VRTLQRSEKESDGKKKKENALPPAHILTGYSSFKTLVS
jgi:hypothetical protein